MNNELFSSVLIALIGFFGAIFGGNILRKLKNRLHQELFSKKHTQKYSY